jgi:hypothetical protein
LSTSPRRSSAAEPTYWTFLTNRFPISETIVEDNEGEDEASEEACWDVLSELGAVYKHFGDGRLRHPFQTHYYYCGDATRSDLGVMVTWTDPPEEPAQGDGPILLLWRTNATQRLVCLLHPVSADMHSTKLNKNRPTELHVLLDGYAA